MQVRPILSAAAIALAFLSPAAPAQESDLKALPSGINGNIGEALNGQKAALSEQRAKSAELKALLAVQRRLLAEQRIILAEQKSVLAEQNKLLSAQQNELAKSREMKAETP